MQTITYYLNRIKDLGLMGIKDRVSDRVSKRIFAVRWKKRALANNANHQWEIFAKKESINQSFEAFFETCKKRVFPAIAHKESYQKNSSWKVDTNHNYTFPDLFYQHMKITTHESRTTPDVKIPWELSRFQYSFSNEETFCTVISDWIKQNQFLIGVNWMCPMEVAIRSINWIVHFQAWKNSTSIPISFWKTFLCALYDHLFYLEHNWEISDRPNNHYIADLVGHFYLAHFFGFEKRAQQTFMKIIKESDRQILPDGTCYEGSNSYHKLDTELLRLFILLCNTKKIILPESFLNKYQLMEEFLSDCASVQIGDNDSGKIINGITIIKSNKTDSTSHYPNFGITIIRTNDWLITYRHPTYMAHQPSGHFHNDQLAVTVTYKNIPILVDPGSYSYTGNKGFRNLMRSYKAHNTFYSLEEETVDPTIDLFQLPRFQQIDTALISKTSHAVSIENHYKARTRTVLVNKKSDSIVIEDKNSENTVLAWNFIFYPSLKISQKNPYLWEIAFQDKKIIFTSNIIMNKENGFYAPNYGIIKPCNRLYGTLQFPQPKIFTELKAA